MKNNKKYNLFNNFFKIIISKKGFTFIELIIAITILAILSVIGFISYNSHLSTSRDTVRKSDLSEIYSLLDYYKIKAPLIVPDKKIEIYSNGTLLGYQGYLSDNIISNIGFKGSGKDPIDDIFYTYYLTSDYRNTGVMAFLENNPNQLSYVNSAFLPKIYAIDYSDRYPIVFGKKIGILLDENKIPIQENASLQSTGKLEISTITSDYTAYIDNKTSISNSGYTMEVLYGTVLTGIVGNDCDQYIKESNGAPLISGMYLINSNTGIYEKYCDMGTTSGSGVNTRIANCSGSLPSNSYAINGNTYIQRYNGTTWIPELSWAENQLIGCDFDCNNNYSWSGSINSCLQISNGVCGSSNGIATLVAPISNLCSLGTSTSVISNIGDYTWSCNGINDGTNSICNAQRIYIVSGNFGANANGATINVCGTNVTADSSGNFTTTRNYGAVCNTITATRTNYTCITTQNGPASLESDTTNIEGSCTLNTYTVSGGFGANANGATINVCGTNATADSSGNFTTTVTHGTACNNVTAARTGYTCTTTTNGPASLESDTTNIAGNCTINTYTVSGGFGANANGATINVCGTNATADSSGNFTTTRNYGDICNAITASRTGYTCNTTTNGPASLESDTTNIEGSCTLNTYTVSGGFGANASGATINVCGTNVTADSIGNFTTTRNYGAVCNTITATRTNYTCSTTINGPASLTANTTNIAGSCTLNTYTVSGGFGANANGATINVCGTNATADSSGNFTTTRTYGAVCNTITATRAGYTCTTTTNGPASLTTNTTNIAGSCTLNTYTIANCSTSGQILASTTTYGSCDSNDIIVCSGSGTGYIISSCNLGTNISGFFLSSYGNYFQWGRNKGFPYGDVTKQATTIAGTVGLNAGTDTYGFVWNSTLPSPYTWANTDITDNWGNTTNTNIARQGPCVTGYHVPSQTEWSGIVTAGGWGMNGGAMQIALKMPITGVRPRSTTTISTPSNGRYWSSTPIGNNGSYIYFNSLNIFSNSTLGFAYGMNVRCFKN